MHSVPFGKAARQGPALAARVQQAQRGTKHIVQIHRVQRCFLARAPSSIAGGRMHSNCTRLMPFGYFALRLDERNEELEQRL